MSETTREFEFDTQPMAVLPEWARGMRLTKEQLAAAERTRDYHLRRLQSQLGSSERETSSGSRAEH